MFDVKPKKLYVNFWYQCPNCEHDIYVSFKEVKKIGRSICEYCSKVVVYKPIRDIEIKIHYEDKVVQKTKPKPKPKPKPKAKSAVLLKENNIGNKGSGTGPGSDLDNLGFSAIFKSLIELGYKRKEASRRVEKATYILGKNAADEEILKKALSL